MSLLGYKDINQYTSEMPVEKWYEVIGEKTIADATLDRLVYSPHRMELRGESFRKRKKQTNETKKDHLKSLISGIFSFSTHKCARNLP